MNLFCIDVNCETCGGIGLMYIYVSSVITHAHNAIMHLAVETGSREGGVRAMRDVWQQRQQRWVPDQTGGVSGCCFFSPLPTSLFRKWLAAFTI